MIIFDYQNFLVDGTGHVKLTDFGLATGALNPQRIESLKVKVPIAPSSYLESVSDVLLIFTSLTR